MSTTDVSCDSKPVEINDKEQLRVKVVFDHLKESQLLTHFCPCVVYGKVKGFEIHLARILWMP